MEIEDCAFPLVKKLTITSDVDESMKDVDWALLIGSKPRGAGMTRGDLIREKWTYFYNNRKKL